MQNSRITTVRHLVVVPDRQLIHAIVKDELVDKIAQDPAVDKFVSSLIIGCSRGRFIIGLRAVIIAKGQI